MIHRILIPMTLAGLILSNAASADDFSLTLRSVQRSNFRDLRLIRSLKKEEWKPAETAVIVCDTWDLHHCLNAVRRLEEFAPRLNELLVAARKSGATIIHAPSDCMPAYVGHPARVRAESAPKAENAPPEVAHWCSRIPAERDWFYPIDQSDGGEDDDPAEHAEWAAKLKAQGRNPGMPWKTQSALIVIDPDLDYISDRGDEVYNILKARGIRNVILTGVHTNMCVLGRPFGLRQMVRNGFNTTLVRDLTDSMYNPKRWPFVDHFTGHDNVISYVEYKVCPTITSDQILGGEPFHSKYDSRKPTFAVFTTGQKLVDSETYQKQWTLLSLPERWDSLATGVHKDYSGPTWLRCAVRVPAAWGKEGLSLRLQHKGAIQGWCNGVEIPLEDDKAGVAVGTIPQKAITPDEANLLVVRLEQKPNDGWIMPAEVTGGDSKLSLKGYWQVRLGDDPTWSNIPLPAKFGASPDILFEPPANK